MTDLVTSRVIFSNDSITLEQAKEMFSKHTKNFFIANFYVKLEVGANEVTFAVVDLPQDILPKVFNDPLVKDIDLMSGGFAHKKECYNTEGG